MPEMSVREFKQQLKGWQPSTDELTHRMTKAEVLVGGRQLVDNDETVEAAGISPDAVVQVLFSINPAAWPNFPFFAREWHNLTRVIDYKNYTNTICQGPSTF